jgi:hypothetical protein
MPDDPRMTDTTKEAVERLAALYADAAKAGSNAPFPSHAHTAATLRALLAERDAARALINEAMERVCADPGHDIGLAATIELARRALAEPQR